VENIAVQPAEMSRLASILDAGELRVLLLADERKATAIIDERLGRAEARQLGVKVMGTVGLLEYARKNNWLTDDDCLAVVLRLRANKFSIPKPGANDTFAEYVARLE
jgi:predicted nucleic acid-binding protein